MNKITKIFDNIGFLCSVENNLFIPQANIQGYTNLDNTCVGYYIPYLVRNIKEGYKWETGVGEIQYLDSTIVVKRHEVGSSSNNNKAEKFIGNANEFYLFVNNTNFNTAFNNVILKTDHFNIDTITSIYLVDNTNKNIDCLLPDVTKSRNVVVDLKPLSSNHSLIVRNTNGSILESITVPTRLVCDGQTWYIMNDKDFSNRLLSQEDITYTTQSVPGGEAYSFQFNDGSNNFAGSELYWGSGDSNKLLLGSNSENLAHTVIPTSGSENTIFNQDLQASDFIVYGSGQPYRNLFFSYDGRVGVNIPSGSRPQTIFHIVNYACSEILRLENRTSCQPAKITLYHKPSGLQDGGVCSILNLAGKDVNGNQKDYANITSIADDTTNGYGGIVLSVSSGNNQISLLSGNLDHIYIGNSTQSNLDIANNGDINLTGIEVDIRAANTTSIGTSTTSISFNNTNQGISLVHNSLSLGSGPISATGPLSANSIITNSLNFPNIAAGSILTISSDKNITPVSGVSIDSSDNAFLFNSLGPNKFLTTDSSNKLVGTYNIDDYFRTDQDILWNKHQPRTASVCLKQVVFDAEVPIDEFDIGDQILIDNSNENIYRNIESIILSANGISELILDQNVTTNSISGVLISSITKGGYLTIGRYTENNTSDSSDIVLSVRPKTETVFNTKQKDIDFTIYGQDTRPALKVYSSAGSVTTVSGIYYSYATMSDSIKQIVVNTVGNGITNNFSTANFNTLSENNLFSGILSSVGTNGKSSYYGTYDQNGNVAEWVESDTKDGLLISEYVAGGSFRTLGTGILAEQADHKYLKNISQLSIQSSVDYVGFRVASISNIIDAPTITNIGLSFVNVVDSDNIADDGDIYLETNGTFEAVVIPNLGIVDRPFRMSTFEVTNTQYASFLNALATGVDNPTTSGLYNPKMSSEIFGGINKSSNGVNQEFTIKTNMETKPINYVSYINSLQFINWLHNGAPVYVDPNEYNSIINDGAYTILTAGSNYYVTTNPNKKYFLPSLDQWHKAAYFEFKESVLVSGSPVVTVGTDTPYVVATELLPADSTETPKQIVANLTVNGWLVVDKILVRDGAVISSLKDIGFEPDLSSDNQDTNQDAQNTDITTQSSGGSPPPTGESSSDTYRNNSTSSSWGGGGGTYGEKSPPLPPDGLDDADSNDCTDPELIATNNVPYWCSEQGREIGPYFY